MIGLDANVLVRYFAKDDPVQTPRSIALLDSLSASRRGYIPLVALAEFAWVMGRRFAVKRVVLARIVSTLIESEEIVLESAETVSAALRLFQITTIGFADCLIIRAGQAVQCDYVATFDRSAARQGWMQLVD
ncbi:PIN domain-containing protein [Cupriavidus campinensis]